MDLHFQQFNIKRHLKYKGISPDLVDTRALLDKTLYYPENIENIDGLLNLRSQADKWGSWARGL